MGKLAAGLVVIGLIALVAYFAIQGWSEGTQDPHDPNQEDQRVRVEEKYGVTTEGVGG